MKRYNLFSKVSLALVLFGALLAPGGCGVNQEPADGSLPETAGVEPVEDAPFLAPAGALEQQWPMTVNDEQGRAVTFEAPPERIVSMSPSNTEVLFALGLGDRIVGVTDFCNYPQEALAKEKIGGFNSPSMEKIYELQPDLVLASSIHAENISFMEELGLTVLVIESPSLHQLYATISLVAEVSGDILAGEELIIAMQQRINAVENAVSVVPAEERLLIYYEVYSDPLMSVGGSVFLNEVIFLAGGVNIFADLQETYPTISAEVVVDSKPDVILFPDHHGTADLVIDEMFNRPGWSSVPAIAENRVYALTSDAFARPGPRIVEAVEEAARLFYPELF